MSNKEMQNLARKTMAYLKENIKIGMSLKQVKELCENYMINNGADSFWYWNVGAFVFSNTDTTLSISAKNYEVSNTTIKENDIITVDLSPQVNHYWGDYARTIIIENGNIINSIHSIHNDEWKKGLLMEEYLHQKLKEIVTVDMTFEELYFKMNDFIKKKGLINLDYKGNLGHSINKKQEDRIYIEKGNKTKLSEVSMFTFEPHIRISNSNYGFKKEDIYYFENNTLVQL